MLKLVVWGEKLKADFVVNWYFNCLNGIQCTSILPVKHKRLHPNTVPWKSSHRTACHHRLPHIMLITHQCSENKNTQCDVQQNFILTNMLSRKIARQKRKKTHTQNETVTQKLIFEENQCHHHRQNQKKNAHHKI